MRTTLNIIDDFNIMRAAAIYLAPILAVPAWAQSAPQFELVVQENLPVTYQASDTEVTPPGVLLPRNDTLEQPTVSLPESADPNSTYVVFLIDQDVPRNGTTFTLLHWFQPSLHRFETNSSLTLTMIDDNIPSIEGAPYIPPTPPAGSGPHRYTFLLYTEPDNFTLPAKYSSISPPANSSARIGFNLTAFAADSGLGEPIAANYLRVLNGTEAETSSAATMTGTSGVAPTEQPTVTASTTNSAAASSANSPSGATTGGEGSATESATAPSQTASGAGPIGGGKGSFGELMMGLALAVVGAGMWMA